MIHFIQPPTDPVALYIEKIGFATILLSVIWAYDCFVMYISWLARSNYKFSKANFNEYIAMNEISSLDIYSGAFLEPASSAIIIIFLSFGLGVLLWFRGKISTTPHV